MSYCRWSSDDFKSDLYCYESDRGYVTWIASTRPVYKSALPPKIELSKENVEAYIARWNQVSLMLNEADRVPIGLKYDGENFLDETPEEFLQTLLMLKEEGYNFPDYVIEAVKEEIEEANASSTDK